MALSPVTHTFEIPDGAAADQAELSLRCVASTTGHAAAHAAGVSVVGSAAVSIGAGGQLLDGAGGTLALRPNYTQDGDTPSADVITSPAGTYWELAVNWPGGRRETITFRCRDDGVSRTLDELVYPTPAAIAAANLGQLGDVDVDDAGDTQALVKDGARWVPGDVATPDGVVVAVAAEATARAAADALKVAKAGDTMSGALAMGGNKVTGAARGTAATDLARVEQAAPRAHGRQHISESRGLTAGVVAARAGSRPLRVLTVADSIGELAGLIGAWSQVGQVLGTGTVDPVWCPPRTYLASFLGWVSGDGVAADVGVDRRGVTLTGSQTEVYQMTVGAGARIRVLYTALAGGGTMTVSGDLSATVDTSEDENGDPAVGTMTGQRWVSGSLSAGTYDVTIGVSSGTVRFEALQVVYPTGVDAQGSGLSGQSAAECETAGTALSHLEAMVARDEAPDLIVVMLDTGDSPASPAAQVADTTSLVATLTAACPTASVAYVLPHGHAGPAHDTWESAYVPALRAMAVEQGWMLVDGWEAIGDLVGDDPYGFAASSIDRVHLSLSGLGALDDAVLDAVLSRLVSRRARLAAAVDQLAADVVTAQATADDHIADTTGAHAATAISATASGLTVVTGDDVQEMVGVIDTALAARALLAAPTFTGGGAGTDPTRFRASGQTQVRIYPSTFLGPMIGLYSTDAATHTQASTLITALGLVFGPGGAAQDVSLIRVAAGILGVRDAATTGGAALSFVEQTAPAAPAANGCYLYAKDNGGGKTQLMARFSSGAEQQVAIQP